ncbi:MAG: tannase/feruloyl esterase family alpha/beta hydrolase [Rhodospirillaceae bacterium]|nr:tannase/feruloyl esterase family alpha/beta hydrolase [Rhodospirillaceae bacterium]
MRIGLTCIYFENISGLFADASLLPQRYHYYLIKISKLIDAQGTGLYRQRHQVCSLGEEMMSFFRSIGLSVASLAFSVAAICNAGAAESSAAEKACAGLMEKSFETAADRPVSITAATYVTKADQSLAWQFMFFKRSVVQGLPIMNGDKANLDLQELPPHCRVEGYVAPAVKFLVLLPEAAKWNGDIIHNSCDAFCGLIDEDAVVPGLMRGYAAITTDGGHVNRPWFDGMWGYNNRDAEIDFAYMASHLAAQSVKAISAAYYGKAHSQAYTVGFSKGGHSGIKSALLYPEDFDGVVSRAPVVRYQAINAARIPYLVKSNTRKDGTYILGAKDVPLIHKAAIESCDSVDGLEDGLIEDPRKCNFDPGVLLCKAGAAEGSCLSAEQVETLRKIYAVPTNDSGVQSFPHAVDVGSELDWPGFVVAPHPGETYQGEMLSRTWLRYLAFDKDPGPTFDWRSFDPVKDAAKLEPLRPMYDADETDFQKFREAGGKMIVVHGWGDGAVSAQMTIDWYEKVKKDLGKSADDFLRFYTVPGSKHGFNNNVPAINESLEAVKAWVKSGKAPDALLFKQADEKGNIIRTRPVYPYPAVARYTGKGDVNDAKNFKKHMP